MPSVKSLQAQQYYAHPRNAFWPIMANLFKFDLNETYQHRVEGLMASGVSVWDVLYECERAGSLDSNIQLTSEIVNDFVEFFTRNPSINTVAFNGQAARKIFKRHCQSLYDQYSHFTWVDLPSSSPAYAAMSLSEKTEVWSQRLLGLETV